MAEKILGFLSKNKTLLFLIMCLMVHACNIAIFFFLGIYPLSILNVFSTIFYSMSFLSEIFTGCAFFYIFYVIGIISVVIYLLQSKERLKHIVQGIGVLYAVRMVKIV